MRNELSEALCMGQDPAVVGADLKKDAERVCRAKCKKIDEEVLACKLILEGMKAPKNSKAYELASAFMADYRRIHEHKSAEAEAENARILHALMTDPLVIDEDETEVKPDGTEAGGKND